ncbi:hypothetical protein EMCRGX_G010071 [Ephydatia muelleri]
MTSTFSAVINVGMLGLLRRLHRLQIQFRLEAESAQNGIRYPHCEKHKNKDGSNRQVTFSLQGVTDADIEDAVKCGRKLAMKDIEMLGMELSLERNMEVETESAGSIIPKADEDDDELDDDKPPRSDVNEELLKEACCAVDENEVMSSLHDLKSAKLIEGDLHQQLVQMQEAVSYKKVSGRIALMTAHKVTLTTKAIDHITTLCVSDDQQSQKASIINISTDLKNVQEVDEQIWVKCGDVTLTKQEKDRLIGGHELSDTHINFAQLLLKQQFPNIDGFRNTLQQNKPFIKRLPESSAKLMQVIFIRKCHWACILLNENQVSLYDSAYTSVSTDTFQVVARLVQCAEPSFKIEVMNISKQNGAVDCGLYAIAVLTSLAFGQDPTTLVYDQEAMRPHLITSFETKKIVPFPVLKHSRPANKVAKVEECILHCYCRMPDDGYEMLQDMALQQIAQINALLTEADGVKLFGLREDYNPLLYIPADLYLITYCDFFKPVLLDEWKSVAKLLIESFNSNVRMYNVFENRLAPSRDIAKRLQHLRHICHGGNASERCGGALKELYFTPLLQHMVRGISMRELLGHKAIYQPGVARKSMRTSRTISTLQLISAGKHATTLGHLLQCGIQYDIVLGMFALTDKVLEHLSVVSQNTVLMKYGILLTTFKLSDGSVIAWCKAFMSSSYLTDMQPLVNEYDCPLLDLSTTIFCTAGNNIQRPVSFVHQCSGTCLFKETGASIRNVERDIVQEDTLIFKHVWNNTIGLLHIV